MESTKQIMFFFKEAGYRMSIQKSMIFLYNIKEEWKLKI